MDTKNTATTGVGGWAILADFSGLLVKAAAVGLAASLFAAALVLLVARYAG